MKHIADVDVLGTPYKIVEAMPEEDKYLEECDGYCDKTTKYIAIKSKTDDCDLSDFEAYRKVCIRHEIIHAFLFESGLQQNFKHEQWGHDETMVDWVAMQFPKMLKAFETAGAV